MVEVRIFFVVVVIWIRTKKKERGGFGFGTVCVLFVRIWCEKLAGFLIVHGVHIMFIIFFEFFVV